MAERRPVAPRTFFLNETHEHTPGERTGHPTHQGFSRINWSEKGRTLAASLSRVRAEVSRSVDPLRGSRLFMLSRPEANVEQDSKSKSAKASGGVRRVDVDFSGVHARVFERLQMDLLRVTSEGDALVHAKPEVLGQLESAAAQLQGAGKAERARWAFLKEFRLPPIETRVDMKWLRGLDETTVNEVIVEFQPVLTRDDADRAITAIRQRFSERTDERVLGAGRDLSGRRWVRVAMRPAQIEGIATDFQSVQSIHVPLRLTLFGSSDGRAGPNKVTPSGSPSNIADMPVVAIVDAGIPKEHPHLAAYRRGEYRHREAEQTNPGDHGSRIASRVVFGDFVPAPAFVPPPGQCRFLDIVVPAFSATDDDQELDGKALFESIGDVVRTFPDVRVFNLSLGSYVPLGLLSESDRHQRHVELQDLDNFAFHNDVVVVVAAGNTRRGVVPNVAYPNHLDEADWGMGALAAGFNTFVVGGYVPRANTDGVARRVGWPSPFTRVGPGIADAPVPGFSAGAGDCTPNYHWGPGLGVGTSSQTGVWEDAVGTSHAAPIVAREAAMLLRDLQKYCPSGVRPFASTVRAFLHLVSRREGAGDRFPAAVEELAARTLGQGCPRAERLESPRADTAVFLWQGTLEAPRQSRGFACPSRAPG